MRSLIPLLASACVTTAFRPTTPDDDAPPRDDTEVVADETGWSDDTGRDDTGDPPVDDTDDDDAPDTDAGDDTFDTGIPLSSGTNGFRPDRLLYEAELAVDGSAQMRSFFLDGREVQPFVRITLSDGVDHCTLKYLVDPRTFDWADSPASGGTTWAWLVEIGFDWPIAFGWEVDEPGYEGRVLPGGRCDDLAPGYFDPTVFAWARAPDADFPDAVHVGVGSGGLTAAARTAAAGAGVPAAKRLVGIFAIPPLSLTAFDDRLVHAYAVWAPTDAGHAVVVDAQGAPALADASGAIRGTRPSKGWYRVVGAAPLDVRRR